MKTNNTKLFITAAFLSLSATAFAQQGRVGINTTNPKTTMDVNGKTANMDGSGTVLATDMTGFQAPRLTRQELTAKGDLLYGADQKGAMVYITDVSAGDALSQRINVTEVGYYYFDGLFWQKFVFAASGLDKTDDEWINDPTNGKIHIGKKSDGTTARNTGTEVVVLDNGRVGIGTNTPTANLQVVDPSLAVVEFGDKVAFNNGRLYLNHHNNNTVASRLSFFKSKIGSTISIGSETGVIDTYAHVDGASTSFFGTYKQVTNIASFHDAAKTLSTTTDYLPGLIRFSVGNDKANGYTRIMTVASDGVLIEGSNVTTLRPAAKLHVIKSATELTPAIFVGCVEYVDNAAAVAAGLVSGSLYRTGDLLKVVH